MKEQKKIDIKGPYLMNEKELFSRLSIDSDEFNKLSDDKSEFFDPCFPKPIQLSPGKNGVRFSSVEVERYIKEKGRFKNKVINIGKSLLESPLCTPKEIVNSSTSIGLNPGIYFLIQKESVVYVGQSLIAINRVGIHAREGKINFDSFSILECDKDDLDLVESLYIHMLRPIYNGQDPFNEDSPIRAPLNPHRLFDLIRENKKSNGGEQDG